MARVNEIDGAARGTVQPPSAPTPPFAQKVPARGNSRELGSTPTLGTHDDGAQPAAKGTMLLRKGLLGSHGAAGMSQALAPISAPIKRSEHMAPVSGRFQDLAYSTDIANRQGAVVYATELEKRRSGGRLDQDPQALAQARALFARMVAAAIRIRPDAASWGWELHQSSDPGDDAAAMAGGKVLVGGDFIASYHLTDEEVAVVLAHEIAHSLAEHTRETVTFVMRLNPKFPGRDYDDAEAQIGWDFGTALALTPLSRTQEREADQIGIEIARVAGIPAEAVLGFYRKLVEHQSSSGSPLVKTHDSPVEREQHARAYVSGWVGGPPE